MVNGPQTPLATSLQPTDTMPTVPPVPIGMYLILYLLYNLYCTFIISIYSIHYHAFFIMLSYSHDRFYYKNFVLILWIAEHFDLNSFFVRKKVSICAILYECIHNTEYIFFNQIFVYKIFSFVLWNVNDFNFQIKDLVNMLFFEKFPYFFSFIQSHSFDLITFLSFLNVQNLNTCIRQKRWYTPAI